MIRNLNTDQLQKGVVDEKNITTSILHSLIYYDIFNYPLTANEIAQFCSVKIDRLEAITETLESLSQKLLIFRFDEFYSLKNDASVIERRKNGNHMAASVLPRALTRSRLIQKFPFVRSVNISGSLSKNYFDTTTDIDFFVITESDRIWLTRLMLTVFKKIFLLNSRKYFCINYYIDTADMIIPDKNVFSATEIITLKNQTGEKYYRAFIEQNEWIYDYFPNFFPSYTFLDENKPGMLKRGIEKMFAGKFGDRIEKFSFNLTAKFLKHKYSKQDKEFNINFRTKKHASKHHPQGFQFKVINAFLKKCREFESQHTIKL